MNVLDLSKLGNFVRVVDLGSVTKAAATLCVAQSALSRQIRDLEHEFGDTLFHRTGRGVAPTEFAKQILPRIRTLLLQAEQLAEDIGAHRGSPNGDVRLSLIPTMSAPLLTPLLSRIADQHPGIQIHVREGITDDVEEWLASGRADLGILYGDRRSNSATDELLMYTDLYLVGASGDPAVADAQVPLSNISNLSLILPSLPNPWRRSIERACADHSIRLKVPFELDAVQTIKDLVSTKRGYSIFPLHAIYREVANGILQASQIVDPSITRSILLSQSSQRPRSRASTAVAKIIRDLISELVRTGEVPGHLVK
jgi:DNA-binding transcriptional LysR family regulator